MPKQRMNEEPAISKRLVSQNDWFKESTGLSPQLARKSDTYLEARSAEQMGDNQKRWVKVARLVVTA